MKLMMTVFILTSVSCITTDAQVSYTRTQREVFEVQKRWLEAYRERDSDAAARIEGDDFVLVDEDGKFYDKRRDLERIKSDGPADRRDSFDTLESQIRVFGNGAVINGKLWVKRHKGSDVAVRQFAYTATYVKRKGKWQIVTAQLTRISSKYDR